MAEYIDRKALGIGKCNPEIFDDKGYANGWNAAIDIIQSAPAADVRPVVHGKWIQDCDYHFRCSVCGDRWTVSNGNPLDVANGWSFCPNCGAGMREES